MTFSSSVWFEFLGLTTSSLAASVDLSSTAAVAFSPSCSKGISASTRHDCDPGPNQLTCWAESDFSVSVLLVSSFVDWSKDVDSNAFSICQYRTCKTVTRQRMERELLTPVVASDSPLLPFRTSSLLCCAFSNSSLKLLASVHRVSLGS